MQNIRALDEKDLYLEATLPLKLKTYTVATLPSAATHTGCIIFVSDGSDGTACICVSNGTNWLASDDLAAASSS
jgi:hypothetical protein